MSAKNGKKCSSLLPRAVRIELLHRPGAGRSVRPQVLLVHDAVLIDDERLHPGHTVLSRVRDQREAADQAAVGEVVVRAAGCILPLGGEYPEVVAPVRYRSARALGIALAPRLGDERAERTGRLARVRRPVEPIPLSRAAR